MMALPHPSDLPIDFAPPEILRAALKGYSDLGPRPERRRASLTWESRKTTLEAIIDQFWPDYVEELSKNGFCTKCYRHIGRGRGLHESKCNG